MAHCPICGSVGEDIVFAFYCSNKGCRNYHKSVDNSPASTTQKAAGEFYDCHIRLFGNPGTYGLPPRAHYVFSVVDPDLGIYFSGISRVFDVFPRVYNPISPGFLKLNTKEQGSSVFYHAIADAFLVSKNKYLDIGRLSCTPWNIGADLSGLPIQGFKYREVHEDHVSQFRNQQKLRKTIPHFELLLSRHTGTYVI